MPSALAQAVLFTSSYAPLLLIFALLDSWGRGIPSMLAVGLALASIAGLVLFFEDANRLATARVRVLHARHRDGDAIGYVVTYLVPFVGFQNPAPRLQAALMLLIVVIGALYLRSHLFYVNPLLSLAGFRLDEAETEDRSQFHPDQQAALYRATGGRRRSDP